MVPTRGLGLRCFEGVGMWVCPHSEVQQPRSALVEDGDTFSESLLFNVRGFSGSDGTLAPGGSSLFIVVLADARAL